MKNIVAMYSVLLLFLAFLSQKISGDDVVNKLVTGYQGWFSVAGDGSPRNTWVHWGNPPRPGAVTFELYPDMREYPKQYSSNMGNYSNGQQSKLFSSWDDSTVDLHFKWMQQYGIDVAALQVSKIKFQNITDNINYILFDYTIAFRFACQDKSSVRSTIERYRD